MFIFYITKYFFYQVFQRHNAGCTSKLIHYHGNRPLLQHKQLHQFVGRHRFGYDRHVFHVIAPVFRITKHFRWMDKTDHIIDISVIHNDLRDPGFYKTALEFIQRSSKVDRNDFGTWNDTVTYFYVWEIKCILKDFHFRIQFFFIRSIVDATLHEIVQIDFSESLVRSIFVNLHTEYTKKKARQTGR